jgi:hypothetical protein
MSGRETNGFLVYTKPSQNCSYLSQPGFYLHPPFPSIRTLRIHVLISAGQHAWVVDGKTNRFFEYDLNGKLLYSWGLSGFFPGGTLGAHQFSVNSEGNVYVAEAWSGRSQNFRPKPEADRKKVIEPPIPWWRS